MNLGRRTPLAALLGTPLLCACVALVLLGTQWGAAGPQDPGAQNEQTAPQKHEVTYNLTNKGNSVVIKREIALTAGGTVEFHNRTGRIVTLCYQPEVFKEVEPGPDDGDGKTRVDHGKKATLSVKDTAPIGSSSMITYTYPGPGGVETQGGADPIIIVKP